MNYFNDVLSTFMGLECVSYVAVYAGQNFIKNILICVFLGELSLYMYILYI